MIVMKFGGTSVGSAEAIRRVAAIVRGRLPHNPVVVVSAVSGITDKLIGAARDAHKRRVPPDKSLEAIRGAHLRILAELDLPPTLVERYLERLGESLRGVWLLRELTTRSLDYVMSFGELMSSEIVAAHLTREGVAARAYPAWEIGVVTDDRHGEAAVLRETYARVKKRLLGNGVDGVPIVTGFLGRTKSGERTTLGRGGSDYTAAIIGRAVEAAEIEIWTDVSGILSADPRVVTDAFTLRTLTFAEAAELAYYGAKVLHPKTIEPAVQANIPVRILNTFKPDDPGTLVVQSATEESGHLIEGLAIKKGVTLVNITSTRMLDAPGYLSEIFGCLARHHVSIDAVSTSEVSVTLAVDPRWKEALEAPLVELRKIAQVRLWPDRALVCVVGEGMQLTPGVAGRIFDVVGAAGINIDMISQGASELNVTFVVKQEDAEKAMRVLHETFLSGQQRALPLGT
jgi:aspartate kinase